MHFHNILFKTDIFLLISCWIL